MLQNCRLKANWILVQCVNINNSSRSRGGISWLTCRRRRWSVAQVFRGLSQSPQTVTPWFAVCSLWSRSGEKRPVLVSLSCLFLSERSEVNTHGGELPGQGLQSVRNYLLVILTVGCGVIQSLHEDLQRVTTAFRLRRTTRPIGSHFVQWGNPHTIFLWGNVSSCCDLLPARWLDKWTSHSPTTNWRKRPLPLTSIKLEQMFRVS